MSEPLDRSEGFRALEELVALNTVSPLGDIALRQAGHFLKRWALRRGNGHFWTRRFNDSGVWLYSHIDTKPEGVLEAWKYDPFVLTADAGRLVGLGVSDAKFQLLNALDISTQFEVNIIVDGAEEVGGQDAAHYLKTQNPCLLVIADGSSANDETYCGTMGQIDGSIRLRTGNARIHPGRERRPALARELSQLLQEVASGDIYLNLTGLTAPQSIRSLTLEECDVRFDLRFGAENQAGVERFLARWNPDIRQHYGALGRSDATIGPRASFSCPLGSTLGCDLCVAVVAGALPANGNHQPNEWIGIEQIEAHRAKLSRVVRTALQAGRTPMGIL